MDEDTVWRTAEAFSIQAKTHQMKSKHQKVEDEMKPEISQEEHYRNGATLSPCKASLENSRLSKARMKVYVKADW